MDEWVYIDDCHTITDDIKQVHVDTRDFHVITNTDDSCLFRKQHVDDKYLICQSDLLRWVKSVEDMSGGKGEWRVLNFSGIPTAMGWLKYIRFYRYDSDRFVVCKGAAEPFDWRLCTGDSVVREYLSKY